jgi:drug/metabolite transporter (DMT)-like permease
LSAAALALVLAAAVCHAGWNLALKKARGNGLAFFAVLGILEVAVWSIPVALLTPDIGDFSPEWLVAMAVSAAIHMAYFLLLLKAYKSADLSLAYPLARATGPLLSVLAAIIFLGESPSGIALVGALLIIAGSTWIGLSGARVSGIGQSQLKGIAFAVLCGMMIAAYTVWDQQSVTRFAIPVLIFYWGSILMRIAMASPALWTERHTISTWFWHDLRVLLVVAVLAPLAYILVLVAMTLAPLSLVAPAREISILLGVIVGAKLLQEGQMLSRLGAATMMVAGIVLLSVGDRLFS